MKYEIDSSVDEHKLSVDRVVTTAMYDIAERLDRGTIATLISGCRNGAVKQRAKLSRFPG